MYSKEEKKALNQLFWDGFKKEIRQFNSREKQNVKWLNYPTGVKHVYLRLHADETGAYLNYDIQLKDDSIRELFWDQCLELKVVLEKAMQWPTIWSPNVVSPEGFLFNRIQWASGQYDFYNEEDWKEIYAFLKERLIAFDAFYQEFKDVLILLMD
ncbi:MAG: DUF4268 domain-containing protein [Flavobacteriia bacterium]|jgi:hypothetical protein